MSNILYIIIYFRRKLLRERGVKKVDDKMKTVRERTCEKEKLFLSPYATLSQNTKGRAREEKSCDFRTEFGRDRDRIIYANSFKRLKNNEKKEDFKKFCRIYNVDNCEKAKFAKK